MRFIQVFMLAVGMVIGVSMMGVAQASGGKLGKEDVSPVFTEDGQPAGLTVPLPEGCEAAVLQSQVIIFCDDD